jgi:hypothetical protein
MYGEKNESGKISVHAEFVEAFLVIPGTFSICHSLAYPDGRPRALLTISAKNPPRAPAGIAAAKDNAMNHSG